MVLRGQASSFRGCLRKSSELRSRLEQLISQGAAQARDFVLSLIAMCVREGEVEFGVVGLDGRLAVAAQRLVLRCKIDGVMWSLGKGGVPVTACHSCCISAAS